jgi:hypothetical protein
MSSSLTGSVNLAISLTLQNAAQTVGQTSFSLALPAFIQGALANGNGIGKANQLYATQISLANGTPQTLDLYAYGAVTDQVGNAYALTNIKAMIFQNLGVSGTPAETDTLTIGGTSSSAALTSFLASNSSGIIIPGPSGTPGSANTPTAMFWAPGDVGWLVGSSSTNHELVFTSNASGHTILVNIYIIGSTGE